MRKLKTTDIPAACRGIKKLGLKEQIKDIAQKANTVKDVWAFGFDFIWEIFDIATEKHGEAVIYEFLAGPFEMTPEQVGDLDLDVLIANLKQLADENNLAGFFKSAAASMR